MRRHLAAENPSAHQADLATSLNNLGNRLMGMGRYEEASTVIESALEIYRRLAHLSPDAFKPDMVAASANLAASYLSLGDAERAIPLYEHALDESMRTVGNDHPYTLSIRSNLAEACETYGDVERALSLYERALADSTRALGENHPRTLSIRDTLSGTAIRSRIADSYAPADRAQSATAKDESPSPEITYINTITKPLTEEGDSTGKNEEFSNFYRNTIRQLASFLMWQGAPIHLAAELAQDAMVKAYANWDGIRNPQSWVRVSASRELVKHGSQGEGLGGDDLSNLAELLPTRDESSEWEERHRALELLSQLPLRQRQVLAWSLDGYTPSEIAYHLQVSASTVRRYLMAARKRLTGLLREQEQSSQ
ncbi:RNA polymerase sigma factor [Streptomyces asiaticus]|uniref:RNA polymerase sigma factor n=1 Tax=Streptomyces asiaticus TaxID=114695 RepID=UPI00381486F7